MTIPWNHPNFEPTLDMKAVMEAAKQVVAARGENAALWTELSKVSSKVFGCSKSSPPKRGIKFTFPCGCGELDFWLADVADGLILDFDHRDKSFSLFKLARLGPIQLAEMVGLLKSFIISTEGV